MNPVKIRDVDYHSQIAAAKALGVSKGNVATMLSRGKPDSIGLGSPCIEININGKVYPSMRAASDALGISYNAVRWLAGRSGAAQ